MAPKPASGALTTSLGASAICTRPSLVGPDYYLNCPPQQRGDVYYLLAATFRTHPGDARSVSAVALSPKLSVLLRVGLWDVDRVSHVSHGSGSDGQTAVSFTNDEVPG